MNICKEKALCCGCRACEQKCPTKCITMNLDNEGFNYPIIEHEKCVKCGMCDLVCPMINTENILRDEPLKYFGAVTKNEKILLNSSSGGAFSSICNCLGNDVVVFGAKYTDELNVVHGYCEGLNGISEFQKSKYVQSDIGNSYTIVEDYLKKGIRVIFSGTPCQVAGLRTYLRKDYENLLTIDLVCHGVPSQKIFNKYLSDLSKRYNIKIDKYSFRNKKNFLGDWEIGVKFGNDQKSKHLAWGQDSYMFGFLRAIYYRPSCYKCPFPNEKIKRASDITIADFWGGKEIDEKLDDKKGSSLIIINSQKGLGIVEKLKDSMHIYEANKEIAVKQNKNLLIPTNQHEKREEFFKRIDNNDRFEDIINDYRVRKSLPQEVRVVTKWLLPKNFISYIKNQRK